jgi:hypothetical protein
MNTVEEKAGSVDSVRRGRSRRRAAVREHHQHRPLSWVPLLDRGRPEVSWHMRPSGHGGVSDVHDEDGRRADGERASGTCV